MQFTDFFFYFFKKTRSITSENLLVLQWKLWGAVSTVGPMDPYVMLVVEYSRFCGLLLYPSKTSEDGEETK